jgi:hypothetical protein
MHTENKKEWCEKFGDDTENSFATKRLFDLGIPSYLNPEKRKDIYSYDLCSIFPSDLKTVRTPLFMAKELYDIDPQYAITFNLKDGVRYKELYKNIIVMFDVKWEITEKTMNGKVYSVDPMHVTVCGFLSTIKDAIKKSGNKHIDYKNRVNDTSGNAKTSFVLDLRHLHEL